MIEGNILCELKNNLEVCLKFKIKVFVDRFLEPDPVEPVINYVDRFIEPEPVEPVINYVDRFITPMPSIPPPPSCGWMSWGAWAECRSVCGVNTQRRIRHCDDGIPGKGNIKFKKIFKIYFY